MFDVSAGVMDAMPASFAFLHHPDHLSRILNGRLTGLGLITAGADWVTPTDSVAIGVIDGSIVVPAVLIFDRLHLDDSVGTLSGHLVSRIRETIAVGISPPQLAVVFPDRMVHPICRTGDVPLHSSFLLEK